MTPLDSRLSIRSSSVDSASSMTLATLERAGGALRGARRGGLFFATLRAAGLGVIGFPGSGFDITVEWTLRRVTVDCRRALAGGAGRGPDRFTWGSR